ncbi:unnamed protein product [Sympodiomycopsis kandeliae]
MCQRRLLLAASRGADTVTSNSTSGDHFAAMYSRLPASSGLNAILEKMRSQDADFRFMALNDLMTDARRELFAQLDPEQESTLVKQVLELLKDANGEVKNMAVRCLGELVRQIREKEISSIISQLVTFVASKEEELRDIASLGLKTVIGAVPPQSNLARYASTNLGPKLLTQVSDPSSSQELIIDSLDILAEIFERFSAYTLDNAQLQKIGTETLVSMLSHSRPAVRKRAMSALSILASHSASETFTQLSAKISSALSSSNTELLKINIQLVGALARSCPRRLGRRLPDFVPRLVDAFKQDDDELREHCFQTLEQVLLRCPTEVTPFLNQILDVSLDLVKHDPNYAAVSDDEDDEMTDQDDLDEDDLGLDEDYSDDEDLSWKVRRAAVKTLNAAIATRHELLSTFVTAVSPVLVTRFSEREESVRLEVLQTFLSLLKQIEASSGIPQATEVSPQSPSVLKRKRNHSNPSNDSSASPRAQLAAFTPQISKALLKEMISKSLGTRLITATVLKEFARVLDGGLEPQVSTVIAQLQRAMPTAETNSSGAASLKSEIIALLRTLFGLHSVRSYENQLATAVPILTSAIQDRAHRDAIEALNATSVLVRSLAQPSEEGNLPDLSVFERYLLQLYEATATQLERSDSDQEMRENAIETIGVLLSSTGNLLSDKLPQAFSLLSSRLRNEVTRLAAVKAVTRIASSPLCPDTPFVEFLSSVVDDVNTLIRQSNRQLRSAAFEGLTAIVHKLGSFLSTSSANGILTQVEPMLSVDADVNALPQILRIISLVDQSSPEAFASHSSQMVSNLRHLLESASFQGPPLDAVVAFFGIIAKSHQEIGAGLVEELMSQQRGEDDGQAHANAARCIGAVSRSNRALIPAIVDRAKSAASADSGATAIGRVFGLLLLGEVGRIEDFAQQRGTVELVLDNFDNSVEKVKGAAAFALGNMAVGNLEAFLPMIRQHIEGHDQHRFLALAALKELITHGSAAQLTQVADQLWSPLFDICQTEDQATRNMGAECLARLTLADPGKYIIQLQSRLNDPSSLTRAAVIAAVRFTLTTTSAQYDELLAPALVEILSLLKDSDLEVRRHALFAFNSAAHNKPQLIRAQLSILQPLLYEETQIRPELMRKVAMGPFTVTQDDGLDLRKNAFETMYTLLDTCLAQLNLAEYLGRVTAGLRDDDQVKLLCYLILVRLSDLAPLQTSQALEEISSPINESLKIKLKDGATKQEVEKSTELTRAAFRALISLSRVPSANSAPKFQQLLREARTGPSSPLFSEVAHSAVRQQRS